MIIEYFDKDGKSHKLKLNRPIWLHLPKGNTDEFASIKIEESTRFNPVTEKYEPAGMAQVSGCGCGNLVTCVRNHQMLLTVDSGTFKGI